ncbi:MFS transporter [Streptomyces tateyamensis]|uniref:MFS transporter n=1 Tax=Streptomyces tateyamensis TaxID=565073 RepID=A0A2V4NXX6_9ACTN|nr:MFS transporter [Streptomyces tateyamensis]PYC76685.1 MFS transporter [Streptomyces tateyamensis]
MNRIPGLAPVFLAALVGRLSYGTVSLALVLTVRGTTGSYASVGTVLALFGLTAAALAPARARLIDRHGVRRVLPALALLYAALLLALALTGPRWLPLSAAAAGACAPPLGPVLRAGLSELLGPGPQLERAFSVDAVTEELLYVGGPLLVGLTGGRAGLLVSAGLVLSGSLGLALLAPPTARRQAATGGGLPRRVPGIGRPVLVAGAAGLALGTLGLLLVVAAAGTGALPWLEAALAAGSALGGLTHGAVRWQAPPAIRLTWGAVGLGVGVAVAGCAPGTGALLVGVAVLGVFVSPVLATAYLLADQRAPRWRRTAAGSWVNTAFNAGSALGTALAAPLASRAPLPLCFAAAALPLLAAAAGGRLRPAGGCAPESAPPA